MPSMIELSTVEWQRAQVTPTRSILLLAEICASSPRTASCRKSSMVVAGLLTSSCVEQCLRQHVGIDLEADAERHRRTDRGLDHFVKAERVGPPVFVAERVVPEDLAAGFDLLLIVVAVIVIILASDDETKYAECGDDSGGSRPREAPAKPFPEAVPFRHDPLLLHELEDPGPATRARSG